MNLAHGTQRFLAFTALTCALLLVAALSFSAHASGEDGPAAQPAASDVLLGKGGNGGGKPTEVPTATPEPTEVPPGGGALGDMHVSFLTVTYGSTYDTYGTCNAGIVDSDGQWIDGAVVTFEVTDPWAGTYSATTMEQTPGLGNIFASIGFRSRERNSCGKRGIPENWTCTVKDVYHFDYTYAPGLNSATTGSDTCTDGPVGTP